MTYRMPAGGRLLLCTLPVALCVASIQPVGIARAQDAADTPQTTEPRTDPDVPELGETPNMTEPLSSEDEAESEATAEEAMASQDEADRMVEVSLGDWDIKNAVASDLDLRLSEVPLTISVPDEVASTVCPVSGSDLEQQRVVSPRRTCAAKRMSPELRDEVSQQLSAQAETAGSGEESGQPDRGSGASATQGDSGTQGAPSDSQGGQ